jgi:hypothetical protein
VTEADLIYQIGESANRLWTLVQWWASISFGLVALAHFSIRKLSLVLVGALLSLYALFSLLLGEITVGIAMQMNSIREALRTMDAAGELSTVGQASISPAPVLLPVTLIMTFIGTIAFVLYSYWKGRKKP